MPYASDAQRRYFHAAAARGDIGKKTVNRWDKMSKGMDLPEHVKPKKGNEKKACDLGSPLLNGFVDEMEKVAVGGRTLQRIEDAISKMSPYDSRLGHRIRDRLHGIEQLKKHEYFGAPLGKDEAAYVTKRIADEGRSLKEDIRKHFTPHKPSVIIGPRGATEGGMGLEQIKLRRLGIPTKAWDEMQARPMPWQWTGDHRLAREK